LNKNFKFKIKNYILYLDTSEPEAVIALYKNTKEVSVIKWQAHRELSKTLSEKFQEMLEKSKINQKDLAGICVFSGPGSFTGLRIGISFANAIAFGLNIPIYETRQKQNFTLNNPKKIITPFYGAEPKITKPKEKK